MQVITCLLLFSLAVGTASMCHASNPATQPTTTQLSDDSRVVLLIRPAQMEVESGDPVLMTLTVQNRGNLPVELSFDVYTVAYGITVLAPDGNAAPPTQFNMSRKHSSGSTRGEYIPPGTESSYLCRVSAWFDLTERGRYTIKATADGYIRSKRLKVALAAEAQVLVKEPESSSYSAPKPVRASGTGTDIVP